MPEVVIPTVWRKTPKVELVTGVRSLVQIQDGPWGYSSVGRALPLHGKCQRFESAYLQNNNCGIQVIKGL